MAVTRISIAIDDELIEAVRQRVGARGISAFITRAVRHELERERLDALLSDLYNELGPPDEAMVGDALVVLDHLDASEG